MKIRENCTEKTLQPRSNQHTIRLNFENHKISSNFNKKVENYFMENTLQLCFVFVT